MSAELALILDGRGAGHWVTSSMLAAALKLAKTLHVVLTTGEKLVIDVTKLPACVITDACRRITQHCTSRGEAVDWKAVGHFLWGAVAAVFGALCGGAVGAAGGAAVGLSLGSVAKCALVGGIGGAIIVGGVMWHRWLKGYSRPPEPASIELSHSPNFSILQRFFSLPEAAQEELVEEGERRVRSHSNQNQQPPHLQPLLPLPVAPLLYLIPRQPAVAATQESGLEEAESVATADVSVSDAEEEMAGNEEVNDADWVAVS